MTFLSILKCTIHINKITLEKCKSCFWNFVSNFELTTFPLVEKQKNKVENQERNQISGISS